MDEVVSYGNSNNKNLAYIVCMKRWRWLCWIQCKILNFNYILCEICFIISKLWTSFLFIISKHFLPNVFRHVTALRYFCIDQHTKCSVNSFRWIFFELPSTLLIKYIPITINQLRNLVLACALNLIFYAERSIVSDPLRSNKRTPIHEKSVWDHRA